MKLPQPKRRARRTRIEGLCDVGLLTGAPLLYFILAAATPATRRPRRRAACVPAAPTAPLLARIPHTEPANSAFGFPPTHDPAPRFRVISRRAGSAKAQLRGWSGRRGGADRVQVAVRYRPVTAFLSRISAASAAEPGDGCCVLKGS